MNNERSATRAHFVCNYSKRPPVNSITISSYMFKMKIKDNSVDIFLHIIISIKRQMVHFNDFIVMRLLCFYGIEIQLHLHSHIFTPQIEASVCQNLTIFLCGDITSFIDNLCVSEGRY